MLMVFGMFDRTERDGMGRIGMRYLCLHDFEDMLNIDTTIKN